MLFFIIIERTGMAANIECTDFDVTIFLWGELAGKKSAYSG
jgi:hypothetical protein